MFLVDLKLVTFIRKPRLSSFLRYFYLRYLLVKNSYPMERLNGTVCTQREVVCRQCYKSPDITL